MYRLIGSPKTRAFRVIWMMEELGLDYDFDPAGPRSDAVRVHSPAGKVPVLLADGAVLTESVAIMTFLADRHGGLAATPGSVPRARQDAWTHRVLDEVDALLWTAARHAFVLPEAERVAAIRPALRVEFGRNLSRIAQDLGTGPWLTGAGFAIPDLLLTHCLIWADIAKFPVDAQGLHDYRARAMARPAFQRAAAIPA